MNLTRSKLFFLFGGVLLGFFFFWTTKEDQKLPGRIQKTSQANLNKMSPDETPTELQPPKIAEGGSSERQIDHSNDKSQPQANESTAAHAHQNDVDNAFKKAGQSFPALDSYNWLLSDPDFKSARFSGVFKNFADRDFKGHLSKLIELRKGDFIQIELSKLLLDLRDNAGENNLKRYVFQKGNPVTEAKLAGHLDVNLPVCILNINSQASYSGTSNDYHFFIEDIKYPIETSFKNFLGVRISTTTKDRRSSWIQSIDCGAYSILKDRKLYQDLKFIHLLATLGVHGKVYEKD